MNDDRATISAGRLDAVLVSLLSAWRGNRRAIRLTRYVVGAGAAIVPLAYVAYLLSTNWSVLLPLAADLRIDVLLASAMLYAVCTAFGGLVWQEALRSVGQDLGPWGAMRQHLLSAPARYLPGPGGQYVGKMALLVRAGVPPLDGIVASVLELVVICASGLLAALVAFPFTGVPLHREVSFLEQLGIWPAALYTVAMPFALVKALPSLLRALTRGRRPDLRYRRVAVWIVGTSLNWLLVGLAVYLLAMAAFRMDLGGLPLCQLAVAASMLTGLLAFTPMGIGVREGILVMMLGATVGQVEAAALAVGWRLLNFVADGLCFAIAVRLGKSMRPAGRIEPAPSTSP